MTTVIVSPTDEESTHHLSLENSDGEVVGITVVNANGEPDPQYLRRSLYKGSTIVTSPPSGRFDDRDPPYNTVAQIDFSGGRGEEEFERNQIKFYDSGTMWTGAEGKMYPAPLYHHTTGHRIMYFDWPGDVTFYKLLDERRVIARQFQVEDTVDLQQLMLIFRYSGIPGGLALTLWTDDGADGLGTQLDTILFDRDFPEMREHLSHGYILDWDLPQSVVPGLYWIVVEADANDSDQSFWELGCRVGVGQTKHMYDPIVPPGWPTEFAPFDLYYWIADLPERSKKWLFMYKGQLYMAEKHDKVLPPTVYMNGYRGVATGAHTVNSIQDTTQVWGIDELVGSVIAIVHADEPFYEPHIITSNNISEIFIDAEWDIPIVDATTLYIVLGAETWTPVGGTPTAFNFPVTDRPLPVNDYVAYAQGQKGDIQLHREENVAGAWTVDWEEYNNEQAYRLLIDRTQTADPQLWRSLTNNLAFADIVDFGSPVAFGADIPVGDTSWPISNIESYDNWVWALKADGLYAVQDEEPDLVLSEIKYLLSIDTGSVMFTKTPYLYYNIGPFFEQFVNKQQEDIGPNRGRGLDKYRRGVPGGYAVAARGYFLGVDAGRDGRSSVMAYFNGGWHELARSPMGERIRELRLQNIPLKPARLWITTDRHIGYVELGELALEPEQDERVDYVWESYLITAWYSDNLLDIRKYWANLKLFTEGLIPDRVEVSVFYQVDDSQDDDPWYKFKSPYDISPSQEYRIGGGQVGGKRIRFLLRLNTTKASEKGEIKSLVAEYVARFPAKYQYQARILMSQEEDEPMEDIQGDESDFTAWDLYWFLELAKADPVPMRMRCILPEYDNKMVLIDPASLNVLDAAPGESRRLLGSLTLLET